MPSSGGPAWIQKSGIDIRNVAKKRMLPEQRITNVCNDEMNDRRREEEKNPMAMQEKSMKKGEQKGLGYAGNLIILCTWCLVRPGSKNKWQGTLCMDSPTCRTRSPREGK
jgi:hypothetical protein